MVDQLASEYAAAGKPVVFMEQNVTNPLGGRKGRFWIAWGYNNPAGYPYAMVDSGQKVSVAFPIKDPAAGKAKYKAMVDAELLRPPKAEVSAMYTRSGNHLSVKVTVKNLSGVTLSTSNHASVVILVYEDIKVGVSSRYVRSAVTKALSTSLANGATASYTLVTPDMTVANWSKLHTIALAEYQPNGTAKAYDMLQAAIANPAP